MILVTGATGTVGSQVLAALLPEHAGGVRALTRNAAARFPTGVEPVVADLTSGDLSPALDGVEAVFLLTDGLRIAEHDARLASAAAAAGVRRIVKLSALSVGHEEASDPITVLHREGERAVRASGVGWTFLRPTGFMSNALNWAPTVAGQDLVEAPFAHGRTAVVDPADIAAVAACCLTEDGHDQRTYELTGPEPLSPAGQTAILGDVLGRPLAYREAEPAATLTSMVSFGMPPELAYAVLELLRSGQEPFNSVVSSDIPTLLGRPARRFAEWAHAHRDAFGHPAGRW